MTCRGIRAWRDPRGLTLLEVVLAVSILALIVVVITGTLRVGVRAWEAGERQAEAQQELRAIVELLSETLAGAHPYKGRLGGGLQRVVLFQGEPEEVRFVTTSPPLTLDAPDAPYHAVRLRRTEDDRLQLTERLVPAEEPFGDGPAATLSRAVTAFRLQYQDAKGGWQEHWDGPVAAALPAAIRIDLTLRSGRRTEQVPSFVVPLPLGKGAA